jgi:transposase
VHFLWAKGLNAKDIHLVFGGKCLSHKVVHNWVEKFSEGLPKVADDAQPGHPVEIVTEATVQQVEELIRADRRITRGKCSNCTGMFPWFSMQHNA